MRVFRLLLVAVLFAPLLLQPRTASAAQSPPEVTVKNISAPSVAAADGKGTYDAYCAVCHGRDGKGHGPAAPALKGPLPDLTRLAAPSGQFKSVDVLEVVTGVRRPTAHGTREMPMWGPVFTSVEKQEVSKLRIYNLAKYIESMQQH